MQLYNAGLENHPDGSGNLNAIVNGNWNQLEDIWAPALGWNAEQFSGIVYLYTPGAAKDGFRADDVGATIEWPDGTTSVITVFTSGLQVSVSGGSDTGGGVTMKMYRTDYAANEAFGRAFFKATDLTTATHNFRFPFWNQTGARFEPSPLYMNGLHFSLLSGNFVVDVGDFTVTAGDFTVTAGIINQVATGVTNTLKGNTELNLASGELYVNDASLNRTIAVAGTFYEITTGLGSRNLYQATLVTAHALDMTNAGNYFVTWSCNFSGPTNSTCEGGIIIDSVVGTVYAQGERRLNAAGDTGSMSGCSIMTLTASQELSFAMTNETNTTTIVIEHFHMVAIRIQD